MAAATSLLASGPSFCYHRGYRAELQGRIPIRALARQSLPVGGRWAPDRPAQARMRHGLLSDVSCLQYPPRTACSTSVIGSPASEAGRGKA